MDKIIVVVDLEDRVQGSKYVSSVATLESQWENDGDGYNNLKFTTATDIAGITTSKQLLM